MSKKYLLLGILIGAGIVFLRTQKPKKRKITKTNKKATAPEELILKHMKRNKLYTQKELSRLTGLSYRTTRRYVARLKNKGLIKVKGRARGSRVYIV